MVEDEHFPAAIVRRDDEERFGIVEVNAPGGERAIPPRVNSGRGLS
jgi:hypothetical protein